MLSTSTHCKTFYPININSRHLKALWAYNCSVNLATTSPPVPFYNQNHRRLLEIEKPEKDDVILQY